MDFQRRIIASIFTEDVFYRFAQLSESDKKKVKDKVKKKLQEKNGKKPNQKEEVIEEEEIVEDEAPEEEEVPEEETVAEEESEVTLEEGGEENSLDTMVDDLKHEVEVIQKDGQVKPSEVLKLFGNLMKMVNVLIESRHPKKTASVRVWDPNDMVDRLVGFIR